MQRLGVIAYKVIKRAHYQKKIATLQPYVPNIVDKFSQAMG
jgi:hypothetical protein